MKVLSIQIGSAQRLATKGRTVLSAIGKHPVDGRVAVRPLGLQGDEQADPSVHGGLSKAVYAYPVEHRPFWKTVRAQARVSLWDEDVAPGLFGENLSIEGLLEADAFVGDRLVFADCTLAVSEPRLPCFKFNAAMGFEAATKMMVQSGWCGYYLSVAVPGTIAAGEAFEHVHGPREVSIAELFRARTQGR